MRVFGIDPGTIHMGYGVVQENGDLTFVDCGVLDAPQGDPLEQRLLKLYSRLQAMIQRHQPTAVAVEEPFVVQAPRKSALAVGEARAIALLAAATCRVPVFQYTPARVRQTVASYGASSKEQVRDMVGLLLRRPMGAVPLDACDALAVAICHLRQSQLGALLDQQGFSARERPRRGRQRGSHPR